MPSGRAKQAVPLERYTVMSTREVGRALGISSVRVSQIERSAFKKIRAAFAARGYEEPKPSPRPTITFNHNLLKLISEWERERWLHRILVDCDLNDSELARRWQEQ